MKSVDNLVAEAEIRDVHMRYCRAADRCDFDLFRTCFHSDAIVEFSFMSGNVDEFIEMAKSVLSRFMLTTHFTGNCLISVDENTAHTEFYALATHRIAVDEQGPERDYVTSVRYIDKMECRDSEWRILRRRCVLDWARTDPVEEFCDGPKLGDGQRASSDPSYERNPVS